MPRYDYECQSCGSVAEHLFTMSGKPETVACECGGVSVSIITETAPPLVKGACWEIPHELRTLPVGWNRGNKDGRAQEQRYNKLQQETRKRAEEVSRSAHRKDDIRLAAKIPRELFKARQRQNGQNYWTDEGKAALKREGLLLPGAE